MAYQFVSAEEEFQPDPVKCPVCNKSFAYVSSPDRGLEKNRLSHRGRLIYIDRGSCPVCMDDEVEPTIVSLECGHCVCGNCFERLGGKRGADAMMTTEEAAAYDFRRRLHAMDEEQEASLGGGGAPPDQLRDFFRLLQTRNFPVPPSESQVNEGGGNYRQYSAPSDSSHNDEDQEQSDAESSDGSLPPLFQRGDSDSDSSTASRDGNQHHENHSRSSSDDSLPPLFRRRDSNSSDSSAAADDLPGLVVRNSSADEESSSGDSSGPPGLEPRRDYASSTESDAGSEAVRRLAPVSSMEIRGRASGLRPTQLRDELRSMGVDTTTFLTMQQLVEAYVAQKIQGGEATDPYAGMPELMSAALPTSNGVWFLSPPTDNDSSTNWRLHYGLEAIGKPTAVSRGEFPVGSCLAPGLDGMVLVYGPSVGESSSNGDNDWEVHQVLSLDLTMKVYNCKPSSKIVSDGSDGIWCLSPAGQRSWLELLHKTPRQPSGQRVLHGIHTDSNMLMDVSGGVWLHVPRGSASGAAIGAGIWHVKEDQDPELMVEDVHEKAFLALDGPRSGLLVLSPSGASKSKLTNVVLDGGGEHFESEIDVKFDSIHALVDNGGNGAYIHCRMSDERWKLYKASLSSPSPSEFCVCPKTCRIASDGLGGVWKWKKVGKTNNRALFYVDKEGLISEGVGRYCSTSIFGSS